MQVATAFRWSDSDADGSAMGIPEFAAAQKTAEVKSDMHVGVLKKLMNQQELQGQAAVKLINSTGVARGAAEPGKGRSVDVSA